jgi:hypothetical protein
MKAKKTKSSKAPITATKNSDLVDSTDFLQVPSNGLAHMQPVSGAAYAFAIAVTDTSGGKCSELLRVTCRNSHGSRA